MWRSTECVASVQRLLNLTVSQAVEGSGLWVSAVPTSAGAADIMLRPADMPDVTVATFPALHAWNLHSTLTFSREGAMVRVLVTDLAYDTEYTVWVQPR